MYEDVQPAMAAWVSQGLKIYIYSSGSRQAQRNLFGNTKQGDLRELLSGFFDTKSGSKVCDCCCAVKHHALVQKQLQLAWMMHSLMPVHAVLHAMLDAFQLKW